MIKDYIASLMVAVGNTLVTGELTLEKGLGEVVSLLRWVDGNGGKILVIGNGGSSAIASHVVIDLVKNAGLRAMVLSDPSALTCLANDFGYDEAYAKQVECHGRPNDILIAISSSGASRNIIQAAKAGHEKRMFVMTFTGFHPHNKLRIIGDISFYVPSESYGCVELAHSILLHAVCDALMEEKRSKEIAA